MKKIKILFLLLFLFINCDLPRTDYVAELLPFLLYSSSTTGSSYSGANAAATTSYDSEATAAGYTLPNVPVKGVSSIALADNGTSLSVRDMIISAAKVDNNKNGSATRYTPTNTTSTTKGTCVWTVSGYSACSYNAEEGVCRCR